MTLLTPESTASTVHAHRKKFWARQGFCVFALPRKSQLQFLVDCRGPRLTASPILVFIPRFEFHKSGFISGSPRALNEWEYRICEKRGLRGNI